MLSSILQLSQQLIRLNTLPENKDFLEQSLGFVTRELNEFTVERFERNGYQSIIAYSGEQRPEKFKVILNGHLDIIPGKEAQLQPQTKGDRLYGLGSMDMKANLACLIYAFKSVANKLPYPIGLQVVTDEEVGGFDGTKLQVESGIRADFVIAGETTNFHIAHQAKGILWVKINFHGSTAHGAYPWKAQNALWQAHDFLQKIKESYPIPSTPSNGVTINLARIETNNQALNKIPDQSSIFLDIRSPQAQSQEALQKLKSLLPPSSTIEIQAQEPALYTSLDNEYLQTLKHVTEQHLSSDVNLYTAMGSSDARHFAPVDCPGIEFGPIGGGGATDEEWVSISSLESYYQILVKFLKDLPS